MGLFNKIKKTKSQPGIPEIPEPKKEPSITLNTLISKLEELQTHDFIEKIFIVAESNDSLAELNTRKLEDAKREAEENSRLSNKIEDRAKLEEGLYITIKDATGYIGRIDILREYFKRFVSVSQAHYDGVDEIDPFLAFYIEKLKEALIDGQKLKADVCFDVLIYAVEIVHGKSPQGRTPEEKHKVVLRRKEIVEESFSAIIQIVDKIYGDMYALTVVEKNYNKMHEQCQKALEELNTIPDKYMQQIETLGFSGVIEKYPVSHPIRAEVDKCIQARGEISRTELQDLFKERCIANINALRGKLELLLGEVEKNKNDQGLNYDDE